MFNSFGNIFRLTSFGESHGKGVGGVIDGFPSGITIDEEFVQQELNRRRPGQSILTTARKEADKVEFLSGIFEGKSTGCPIGFIVWNENQHSNDYNNLKEVYRPSHADYTYKVKYGIRDHRGGGRSSARETISRVVAGALAKLALRQLGISITAYTSQVGAIKLEGTYSDYDLDLIETNDVRCPDPEHYRRYADLCHQRMPYRTGSTCIRQASRSSGQCHVKYQCRQSLRIWRRIQGIEDERFRTERRFLQ